MGAGSVMELWGEFHLWGKFHSPWHPGPSSSELSDNALQVWVVTLKVKNSITENSGYIYLLLSLNSAVDHIWISATPWSNFWIIRRQTRTRKRWWHVWNFCFPESSSAFEPALALPSGSFLAIKGDAINLRVWHTWVFKCYLCELREVSRAAWDLGKWCIIPSSWGVVSRNEVICKGVRQRHCPLNKHKMLGFEHSCPQKNPGYRDKMHRLRRQPRVGAEQVKSKEFKIFEPPVTDLFVTVWEWNEIVHRRQHAVHGMQSSAEVGLSWRVYVRTYKVSAIGKCWPTQHFSNSVWMRVSTNHVCVTGA